jgi:hypothetical protein
MFLVVFHFFDFICNNFGLLGHDLKNVVILSPPKKLVLLIAPLFYLGVDFKISVVRIPIFKVMISKKRGVLLGAPLFNSGVDFNVLAAKVSFAKSTVSK